MIEILDYTKKPLTTMGRVSGICYGQTKESRFRKIAERCLEEGHGRISEFADITIQISEHSAKMLRELYTHHIGTSKVQASTRYIDYSKGQFDYITPPSVIVSDKEEVWHETMSKIDKAMNELKEAGVPVEDFTNLLPLAYSTKVVLKINVRALINMFNQRACTCAYLEYRMFMSNLNKKLRELDEEWDYLAVNYFVPKCDKDLYCTEETRWAYCKRHPNKSQVKKIIDEYKKNTDWRNSDD